MPAKVLTDRFVSSARTTARQNFFDRKVRGLCLRVTANGTKSWWFVYRNGHPTSQWLALGSYDAVSLAQARTLASSHRHAIDVEQRDPAAEARAAKRAALEPPPPPAPEPAVFTFTDMAELYIAFAKGKKKTWRQDQVKIERYLLPAWGALPLRDITRTHVHELLDTLVAKGMTIGVNRIQAVISRIFTVALDRSLVDAHPAARMIKRFDEQPGERVLTDDELLAFWVGLGAHPGRAADALRLRLLLGQRGAETYGMAWSELDLDTAVWELPGLRTKNKRPHAVPLNQTALAILKRRWKARAADDTAVFPGFTALSDDHRTLAALHGDKYEWKDLRRTVATRLASLGYDDTTIGRVLNHARYTVTAKHYNKHLYLDEKRAALTDWDKELQRIVEGRPKVKARVVRMARRG